MTDRYHEALNTFILRLPNFRDAVELFQYVSDYLVPHLFVEDLVLYEVDTVQQRLVQLAKWGQHSGLESLHEPFSLAMGQGIVGHAASAKITVVVDDTRDEERYIAEGVIRGSECAVPVIYENRVVGVLDSEHPQPHFYTDYVVSQMEMLASLLSLRLGREMAIERLDNTVHRLLYTEKLHNHIAEIIAIGSQHQAGPSMFADVHKLLKSMMYAENMFVAILDKEQQSFHIPYAADQENYRAKPEGYDLEGFSQSEIEQTMSFNVMSRRTPVKLNRVSFMQRAKSEGLENTGTVPEAWMAAPFRLSEQTEGLLVVQSYLRNSSYSDHELEMLSVIANQLTHALRQSSTSAVKYSA